MSTVLWGNRLLDGVVTSDASDKYALYKFADKIDDICDKQDLLRFSDTFDSTDLLVNLDQLEMPEDMESTSELMARDGTWGDAAQVLSMLESVLRFVRDEQPRFGLMSDRRDDVIEELEESVEWVRDALEQGATVNFSIVM